MALAATALHGLLPESAGMVVGEALLAIGLGLGKMFGKTHGYEVEPSQELIAQAGFSEIKVLIFCNRLHTHKKCESVEKV